MNFSKLYNRVVYNEAKEKEKREEDVEQYDHSASVAEQEEEFDYDDYSESSVYKWDGVDVALKLPDRIGEFVVEGTVAYTLVVERPDASNGFRESRWVDVEDTEVSGIFLVGEGDRDAQDITEDATFEEMELAEEALNDALNKEIDGEMH